MEEMLWQRLAAIKQSRCISKRPLPWFQETAGNV